MKRRMPKDPVKAAAVLAELARRTVIKKQIERRELGSSGAAGPMRRIDPKDYKPLD